MLKKKSQILHVSSQIFFFLYFFNFSFHTIKMISNLLKSSKNFNKIKNGVLNKRQFISTSSNNIIKSSNNNLFLKNNQINNNNNNKVNNKYRNNKNYDRFYCSIKGEDREYANLMEKASSLINESKFEEAIPIITKAIQLSPSDPNGYSLRADTFEILHRYDEAIQDYEKVLHFLPESIPCYSSLASCFYNQGDINRAIKYFEHILIIDPNYLPANGYLGDIYFKLGDLSKSLGYYKKVLAIQPNSEIGLLGLGHLAMKQDNKKDAIKIYRQVIKLGEGKPIEQFQTKVSPFENVYNAAKLKGPIECNPIYSANLCLANIFYHQLNEGPSMKYFEKVVEYNPNNSNALALLATLKLQDGKLEEAFEKIERSIQLEPSNFNKSIKADVLFDLGRFEEAVPLFKEVLAELLEGENPDPEMASPRLSILYNLLLSFAHLSSQFPNVIDFQAVSNQMTNVELEELSKIPKTLFELNSCSRHWVKFFERLSQSIYISGTVQREFSDLMLDFFQSIALSAGEIIRTNHHMMQNQSETPLLKDDGFEQTIFEYFENLTSSILNK
ncbi:hypothetical protein RB653_004656 [Dictyostelium firmibasis]|uniref:TPR-like protein n=1 Tax=Dictyostelium firmibasis TaxID=79012 RepID=A0AAN7YXG7_9MYCE